MKIAIILMLFVIPSVIFAQDSTQTVSGDTTNIIKISPEKRQAYISIGAIIAAAGIIIGHEGISAEKTHTDGTKINEPNMGKVALGSALTCGGIYLMLKGIHSK